MGRINRLRQSIIGDPLDWRLTRLAPCMTNVGLLGTERASPAPMTHRQPANQATPTAKRRHTIAAILAWMPAFKPSIASPGIAAAAMI
jgi:hypothetical protein